MGDLITRFISFDKMIGTPVIKVLYYFGLALIILWTVLSVFDAFGVITRDFGRGAGQLIGHVARGVGALLFWRLICEFYVIFFKISDDLTAIRKNGEKAD